MKRKARKVQEYVKEEVNLALKVIRMKRQRSSDEVKEIISFLLSIEFLVFRKFFSLFSLLNLLTAASGLIPEDSLLLFQQQGHDLHRDPQKK